MPIRSVCLYSDNLEENKENGENRELLTSLNFFKTIYNLTELYSILKSY